jgi:hypothetical protein
MPAQSPTLSPTLSAITAGLRGSSSGMFASTLPTRSAPTSAALVKMPPPSRAKTEISEPPKRQADQRVELLWLVDAWKPPIRAHWSAQRPSRPSAHHHQARDRAALEGEVEGACRSPCRRLGDAHVRAHRDVHADEAGAALATAPSKKPPRTTIQPKPTKQNRDRHTDDRHRAVLAAQERERALADRRPPPLRDGAALPRDRVPSRAHEARPGHSRCRDAGGPGPARPDVGAPRRPPRRRVG